MGMCLAAMIDGVTGLDLRPRAMCDDERAVPGARIYVGVWGREPVPGPREVERDAGRRLLWYEEPH